MVDCCSFVDNLNVDQLIVAHSSFALQCFYPWEFAATHKL